MRRYARGPCGGVCWCRQRKDVYAYPRIVHSLECGFVSGIDEVLAITFTSKAAGEIKSRVKGALKACGRTDQALLVDSAWISTIHGACARMLRAHALDLGIAPDFTVADEAAANDMLDASLEEVLGSENDIIVAGRLRCAIHGVCSSVRWGRCLPQALKAWCATSSLLRNRARRWRLSCRRRRRHRPQAYGAHGVFSGRNHGGVRGSKAGKDP